MVAVVGNKPHSPFPIQAEQAAQAARAADHWFRLVVAQVPAHIMLLLMAALEAMRTPWLQMLPDPIHMAQQALVVLATATLPDKLATSMVAVVVVAA
jgi:hypothetical protein